MAQGKNVQQRPMGGPGGRGPGGPGRGVLLFENEWSVQWALDNNDGLVLAETADRGKADEME